MIKIILSVAVSMILIGCATPDVNPSNKGLVFLEGKPYAVPYGSVYGLIDKPMINIFKKIKNSYLNEDFKAKNSEQKKSAEEILAGANIALRTCNVGDAIWGDPKITANEKRTIYKLLQKIRGFKIGKSGCVKPLSKQEYDYYMTITRGTVNASNNNQTSSNSSTTRYKAPTYNFPTNNNIETKKSSNTYYMNSDGTSTNKVGNTYFHSDGTTTMGL